MHTHYLILFDIRGKLVIVFQRNFSPWHSCIKRWLHLKLKRIAKLSNNLISY